MPLRMMKQMLFHVKFCAFVVLLVLSFDLRAELVVVAGAGSQPVSLNKNQVRDVFLGRSIFLPNGSRAVLVDQPEASPLREEFYQKVANKTADEAKQHWAILNFTGGLKPPIEGVSSHEIKKILNSNPGSISYIERSSLDNSVVVIYELK